jgi:hypothetical protein
MNTREGHAMQGMHVVWMLEQCATVEAHRRIHVTRGEKNVGPRNECVETRGGFVARQQGETLFRHATWVSVERWVWNAGA